MHLQTGLGLYNGKDIEFRGSVFTVGGDANIDGLVTFASENTEHLEIMGNECPKHAHFI
jgi:hypothetical protein